MPRPKSDFETLYPCEFYEPAELLDDDMMYTVDEIARLLQGLEPDADLDPGEEAVLRDWAVPWIVDNAADLAIAEPPDDEDPGYYGLQPDE
jgi:hypothetical protein